MSASVTSTLIRSLSMPRANLLRSACVLTLALGATACGTVSDRLTRTEALKPGTGSKSKPGPKP